MLLDREAWAIPAGRELPVFSDDISPTGTAGRLLDTGGSFGGSLSQVAEFQTQTTGKKYKNTMALRIFVQPLDGTSDVQLSAQLFSFLNSTATSYGSPVSISKSPFNCADAFQKVSFSLPITGEWDLKSGSNRSALGVRIWNTGSTAVRIAYDHQDYPATLTVVEK